MTKKEEIIFIIVSDSHYNEHQKFDERHSMFFKYAFTQVRTVFNIQQIIKIHIIMTVILKNGYIFAVSNEVFI